MSQQLTNSGSNTGSIKPDWADTLCKTFFAEMESRAGKDEWSKVTIYINEPHRVLGVNKAKGTGYPFTAREIESGLWSVSPSGTTEALPPGVSVQFFSKGKPFTETKGATWLQDGLVMVFDDELTEQASTDGAKGSDVDTQQFLTHG